MILDASAVLAVLFAEPDAARYAAAVAAASHTEISAVNWFGAAIAVDRRGNGEQIAEFDALLERAGTTIIPFDATQALVARKAYDTCGKGRHRASLTLGDCATYALARVRREPLLFKGGEFPLTDIEPALKD